MHLFLGLLQEHERDVGRDERASARRVQGVLHYVPQRGGQEWGHREEDQAGLRLASERHRRIRGGAHDQGWLIHVLFFYLSFLHLCVFNFYQVPDEKYLLLPTWRSQLKMRLLSLIPNRMSRRLVAHRYRKALPKVSPTPLLGSIRSNSSTMSTVSSLSSRYSVSRYWEKVWADSLVKIGWLLPPDSSNRHKAKDWQGQWNEEERSSEMNQKCDCNSYLCWWDDHKMWFYKKTPLNKLFSQYSNVSISVVLNLRAAQNVVVKYLIQRRDHV